MPDSARERHTLEELDAVELLQRVLDKNDPLTEVDVEAIKFICPACNVIMKPIAIKPNMIKIPHFRREGDHEPDCQLDGYEKLVKKRPKKAVTTPAGFPVGYPNGLRLPTFREVAPHGEFNKPCSSNSQNTSLKETSKGRGSQWHNWTTTTIRPLVKHFESFSHPQDRSLPLFIPGVSVKTYQQVFQRLSYQPKLYYESIRIYFGRLQYTAKISFDKNKIILPLAEGDWQDKKLTLQYYLEIDASTWSKAEKKVFQQDILSCIENFRENQKSNPKMQPWLFFLGSQEVGNDYKFRLFKEDRRLACGFVSASLAKETYSTIARAKSLPDLLNESISSQIQLLKFNEHQQQLSPSSQQPFQSVEPETSDVNDSPSPLHPTSPVQPPVIPSTEASSSLKQSPPPQLHLDEEPKSLELPRPLRTPATGEESKEQLEASSINASSNQQAHPQQPQDQPIESFKTETLKLPSQSQSLPHTSKSKQARQQDSFPTTMPDVQVVSVNDNERENQFSRPKRKNNRRNNRSSFLRKNFVSFWNGFNKIVNLIRSLIRL